MDRPGKNGGTLRSYEKGQSGNPAGRPVGSGAISKIINELGEFTELELTIVSTNRDGHQKRQQLTYSVDGEITLSAYSAIRLLMRLATKRSKKEMSRSTDSDLYPVQEPDQKQNCKNGTGGE